MIFPVSPYLQWFTVQNTGWSNGTSWFETGGTTANPLRFESAEQALQYLNSARWDDPSVKWRYVRVTLERKGNKEVLTKEWFEV